jgi:hypothetical protein
MHGALETVLLGLLIVFFFGWGWGAGFVPLVIPCCTISV